MGGMSRGGKRADQKSTKVVATIGPACAAESVLRAMVREGMDVARFNFSYGGADFNLEMLEKVRKAARAAKRPVAIMQDLQGPKLRVGELPREGITLREGSVVTLLTGVKSAVKDFIPIPYGQLSQEVKRGDRIILDDGMMEFEVGAVDGRKIIVKVVLGGTLLSYQGMAVPAARLSSESLTEKDESDLMLGLKHGVDYIALSYVRSADDLVNLRGKIREGVRSGRSSPRIIAKIEKHEALDNFEEILRETDGIMIARGDLGLEMSASSVPVTQKEIVAKCLVAGKPVITATHMLLSMTLRPRPTRAEVSDVANAVIDHADAVMLSEETAMGRYPVRVVKTMVDIIRRTSESTLDNLMPHREARGEPVPSAVAAAAVELARHVEAEAILVTTRSGYSARAVARFRSEVPVYAATDSEMVQRQLMLSWGVVPLFVDGYKKPEKMVKKALKEMKSRAGLKSGSKVVVVSGLKRKGKGFDSMVRVVEI